MTKVHWALAGVPACGCHHRWQSSVITTVKEPDSSRINCVNCLGVIANHAAIDEVAKHAAEQTAGEALAELVATNARLREIISERHALNTEAATLRAKRAVLIRAQNQKRKPK